MTLDTSTQLTQLDANSCLSFAFHLVETSNSFFYVWHSRSMSSQPHPTASHAMHPNLSFPLFYEAAKRFHVCFNLISFILFSPLLPLKSLQRSVFVSCVERANGDTCFNWGDSVMWVLYYIGGLQKWKLKRIKDSFCRMRAKGRQKIGKLAENRRTFMIVIVN